MHYQTQNIETFKEEKKRVFLYITINNVIFIDNKEGTIIVFYWIDAVFAVSKQLDDNCFCWKV